MEPCFLYLRTLSLAAILTAMAGAHTALAQEAGSEAQFRGIDRDGDNKINAAEAAAYRDRLMITYDENGDGTVTVEEWISVRKLRSAVSPETPVETPKGFTAIDLSGDGAISKAEMTAYGQNRFQSLDADKNGAISADEYRRDGL